MAQRFCFLLTQLRWACRLGFCLLLVSLLADNAMALRGRRARRLAGVMAARANAPGAVYFVPDPYPPAILRPSPFFPFSAWMLPPGVPQRMVFSQPFSDDPNTAAVRQRFDYPPLITSDSRFSLPAFDEQGELRGPELHSPASGEPLTAEPLPPPEGELVPSGPRGRAIESRSGTEF